MQDDADTTIVIRQAQQNDAERIVHLHFDAVHEGGRDFYTPECLDSWSPLPSPSRYQRIRETIQSQSLLVLVATNNDRIYGFAIGSLIDGFIRALYVDPRSWRRGVGKALLASTEGHLYHSGSVVITLKASVNAVEFYKAAGYAIVRPSTQILGDGSEMNCYEMRRALAATG